jgi:hypothetical protein
MICACTRGPAPRSARPSRMNSGSSAMARAMAMPLPLPARELVRGSGGRWCRGSPVPQACWTRRSVRGTSADAVHDQAFLDDLPHRSAGSWRRRVLEDDLHPARRGASRRCLSRSVAQEGDRPPSFLMSRISACPKVVLPTRLPTAQRLARLRSRLRSSTRRAGGSCPEEPPLRSVNCTRTSSPVRSSGAPGRVGRALGSEARRRLV